MDTGATSHLASGSVKLSTINCKSHIKHVFVGNGSPIPVTHTGHANFPTINRPLHIHNVLVTPNIIENLIFVRQFTNDNQVSIEFDPFGFSVKDIPTHQILLRCDSFSDLYPAIPTSSPPVALLSSSSCL